MSYWLKQTVLKANKIKALSTVTVAFRLLVNQLANALIFQQDKPCYLAVYIGEIKAQYVCAWCKSKGLL